MSFASYVVGYIELNEENKAREYLNKFYSYFNGPFQVVRQCQNLKTLSITCQAMLLLLMRSLAVIADYDLGTFSWTWFIHRTIFKTIKPRFLHQLSNKPCSNSPASMWKTGT